MTAPIEDNASAQKGQKRSQPGNTEQDEEETSATNALTPSKKRKLNGTLQSKPPAPHGTFDAIASAISNVFGLGRQAENGNASLNMGAAKDGPKPAPARPAIKMKALRGTIWDNEEKPRLQASPAGKGTGRGRGKGTPKSAKVAPRAKTPKSTPRGKQKEGATPSTQNGTAGDESPSKPRSAVRANGHEGAEEATTQDEDSVDELGAELSETPTKTIPGKRLWGSKAAASPAPKSILTPSKNRGQTPKSVKFDRGADTEVYFDDLPKKPKTKAPLLPPPPTKAVTNEIVCDLCNKGHSRAPNQIILCDNCDYAVHQECYGVFEIPEGDWLCKSCSQEDVLQVQPQLHEQRQEVASAESAPIAVMASVAPDIAHFDAHLRAHQRVLLDRCTGRRRIEMFGLQDAREKAHHLIEQTVVAGEGNSMLLIGARGSGKTTVSIILCRQEDRTVLKLTIALSSLKTFLTIFRRSITTTFT